MLLMNAIDWVRGERRRSLTRQRLQAEKLAEPRLYRPK
jgi:hypothetical protein